MLKSYLKKIPILPGIYRKMRESFALFKSKFVSWKNLINIDSHKIGNSILFVGSGRSGTTWISNLLNHSNQCRYIFEPFKETEHSMTPFGVEPYIITPEMDKKEIRDTMKKILSGRTKSTAWINKFNKRKIANRRIIKSIRVHFILRWIIETFPQIKLVYLMRHPIPSSLSKAGLKWDWKVGSDYFKNKSINKKFLQSFSEINESGTSLFMENIIGWCVQNYVALQELSGKQYLLVFYEDFCANPEAATREMTDYTGLTFDKEKLITKVKENFITTKNSAIVNNADPVLNWLDVVSQDEIVDAMNIVKAFGLDSYYNENPYPLKSNLTGKDS